MRAAAFLVTLASAAAFADDFEDLMTGTCKLANGTDCGNCTYGCEYCGDPYTNAPMFHLMDQHGCAENDPNGPVFDPVHNVIHHFYQIHLAAPPGHGPDYGHFVSKDFVHWAQLPVAIWNGFDVSTGKETPYDNEAIFTGSAIVVDGAGPGGAPGIINIYPGLCNTDDWPGCDTGTLLAQAVPADYENDELLINWTKPSYNPIMESTERDPSTPWQTASGEWRLRTYNSMVYGSASTEDMLAGKWYEIGKSDDFRTCECPSFFPLPAITPGFTIPENAPELPTHVHKTSCGGDWWQLGTYSEGAPKELGNFTETAGWEDLFEQKKIDEGAFYASKDNEYPSLDSDVKRRINWGWAQIDPGSAQTLPREITFNPEARTLEQAPIAELNSLRGVREYHAKDVALDGTVDMFIDESVARQSEVVVTFELPQGNATFGLEFGNWFAPVRCGVDYEPNTNASATFYEVHVQCDDTSDTLRLLTRETTLELRVYTDWTVLEAYFQGGRVAITKKIQTDDFKDSSISLVSNGAVAVPEVSVYPMGSIWVSEEDVRAADTVYTWA